MKSKTSFFDPTLLKKNISRFAPAWAILTLALFLALPLPLMRRLSVRYDGEPAKYRITMVQNLLEESTVIGVVFAFFAAMLFAVLVFKYLHRTKDAYMMHAFPMTRTCQFLTNAVSGLLFWLVPSLLIGLCALGILAANNVGGCGALVWALLGRWLLAFLCFYGIAVFAALLSGNSVIAAMSCVALNFMFLLIPLMVLMLVSVYFKGFDFVVSESILRLSPFVTMLNLSERAMFWVYGGVGLVLLVLAWVHYRFRQVERAGDAMVFAWARIAFRLLFTLCVTLGLGWLLSGIFSLFGTGGKVFLPYALIGCVLGWFGSSMMVERTVKVFKNKKVWIGFAACAGVLILAVACLKYDLLGFQRRIPETARVKSVELWTNGDYNYRTTDVIELTAADDIDVVRAFHESALSNTANSRGIDDLFSGYSPYQTLHICYHLKGGGTLNRAYVVSGDQHFKKLAALYSRPDIAAAWYEKVLPEDFYRVTLYGVQDIVEDLYGRKSYSGEELSCKNPAALRDAVLADAKAGRLPVMNFLTGSDYYDGIEMIERGYYELYLYYEMKEQPGQLNQIVQIPIASTAEETLKLFLP